MSGGGTKFDNAEKLLKLWQVLIDRARCLAAKNNIDVGINRPLRVNFGLQHPLSIYFQWRI
jgi:mannitol-specific phosphotransferase system IIBC component